MHQASTERWAPVLGYEGYYEVSDFGRVRSLDRVVYAGCGRTRFSAGKVLCPHLEPKSSRYLVNLSVEGNRSVRLLATLIAEAFLGPRPAEHQVCHNNGDSTDNRLENLRWDTASANILDQTRHGTHNNARKTQCPRGHEYSGENLLLTEGRRRCRLCTRQLAREKQRRYRERAARLAQ